VSCEATSTARTVVLLETIDATPFLKLEYEPDIATLWITLSSAPKPCLSLGLIEAFNRLADSIRHEHGRLAPSPNQPLKFVVLKSESAEAFNLGGDLDLFIEAISRGDSGALRAYGRAGAAACRDLAWGFDAAIVTISLVRGIALGGGFEAARCCDVMIAEEGATFQLPEASFGLFPASGVISVMSPRIGHRATRRLVVDGEKMSCADALAADVIDDVAPVGEGEQRVRMLIKRLTPRHAAAIATFRGLHRMAGATTEALLEEVDLWVRSAMNLSHESVSMMKRLSRAQSRRFQVGGVESCL
jgi:DSF synthase